MKKMLDEEVLKAATALDVLELIEAWVESKGGMPDQGEGEVRLLWSVLSAMRGPDSGDTEIKREMTAVVRSAALPLLANMSGAIVAHDWSSGRILDVDDETLLGVQGLAESRRWDEAYEETGGHYFGHIEKACEALRAMRRQRESAEKAKGVQS